MDNLLNPEVISAASSSSLGILSLMILVLGIIALAFFRNATDGIKFAIFILLFGGVVGFGAAIVKEAPKPIDPVQINPEHDAEPETEQELVSLTQSFSYSGVTGCDGTRDRTKAIEVCNSVATAYAQNNCRDLVSVTPENISSSISHSQEPWPSNVRSCLSLGSVVCKLRVQ